MTATPKARWPECGREAFEAYSKAMSGLTYDQKAIPAWELLSEQQKTAWELAAHACSNGDWYEE